LHSSSFLSFGAKIRISKQKTKLKNAKIWIN